MYHLTFYYASITISINYFMGTSRIRLYSLKNCITVYSLMIGEVHTLHDNTISTPALMLLQGEFRNSVSHCIQVQGCDKYATYLYFCIRYIGAV